MGLSESKEENILNNFIKTEKNNMNNKITRTYTEKEFDDLFDTALLVGKHKLIKLTEEYNFKKYIMNEFSNKKIFTLTDDVIILNMLLWLSVVFKNHFLVDICLKYDKCLIIYEFLPNISEVISDKIFHLINNHLLNQHEGLYSVLFSFYCKKEIFIKETYFRSYSSYNSSKRTMNKFIFEILEELNNKIDISMLVVEKVRVLNMNNQDLLEHYKINTNNQRLNELLIVKILIGNIELFDILQQKGFRLLNQKIHMTRIDCWKIEIMTLDYLSPYENFDDFIQTNKEIFMKYCNEDVVKYLENII